METTNVIGRRQYSGTCYALYSLEEATKFCEGYHYKGIVLEQFGKGHVDSSSLDIVFTIVLAAARYHS